MATELRNELASDERILTACPCCNHGPLRSIYEAYQIPSHSCLLMDTPDEARTFPLGDLHLGFCDSCGFVTNVKWDAHFLAYDTTYEETQHFSETFHSFAKTLAQRWIDRYEIRNKRILEIGCGKAEFLELMCKLGDNEGIGVDPSVIPERLSEETRNRITFIQDYYATEHSKMEADVICCRHTLEHIHETRSLLETIRESIGDREDTLVLFELPDVTRVLRECAFWDLYYEHCSYFTAGSLARLFRDTAFDVIELERDYGDQYLLIAARPAKGVTSPSLPLEDDLQETIDDVAEFTRNCTDVMDGWRDQLKSLLADGKRTIAWGAGSKCVAFATTLQLTDELAYAVDINPHKQGKYLPGTGHEVAELDRLKREPPDAVVVMNPIYCDEINAMLQSLGIDAELLPLGI